MENSCTIYKDSYKLQLSTSVERENWKMAAKVYIVEIPPEDGTVHCYCSVQRNGKPDFLVTIYGLTSSDVKAGFWRSWLVIAYEATINFISIETQAVFSYYLYSENYKCNIFPAEEHFFVGTASDLFCFNRAAQQLWRAGGIGVGEGVRATAVEGDLVLGEAMCYVGSSDYYDYDHYDWRPFMLLLATGDVL